MAFGRYHKNGFTLVEMVIVIVVLSILALGTTRYIITSSESFVVSAERAKLIATARVAIEQVVRQLRNALPNSIRISNSGRCIEYMPILVGSSTTAPLLPNTTSLPTPPFDLDSGTTNYAVIGAFSPSELYDPDLPSPGVIVATTLVAGTNYTAIPLAGGHNFTRTSPTQRVYLVSNPQRFCVTDGGQLLQHSGYGIVDDNPILDTAPGGANSVMFAESMTVAGGDPFVYTPGNLVRNALVAVNFSFFRAGESVNMSHEIQIRNVP